MSLERIGPQDSYNSAVPVLTSIHYANHLGKTFHADHKFTTVASGSSVEMLVRVPSTHDMHLGVMRTTVGAGDVDVYLFEGPTVTSPGTAVNTVCTNREVAAASEVDIYHTPTTTADGTEIHHQWIHNTGTGTGLSDNGVGDSAAGEEWVLAPNTDYLLRITNNSGSTISIWQELLWYENAE